MDELSYSEFYEWMAYEQVSGPFGGERGDILAGIIASTMANIHRSEKTPAFKFSDFMIEWDPQPERQQTTEEQMSIMLLLQQIQNSQIKIGE